MKRFEITFVDEFECDDEHDAVDQLINYLRECVNHEDVTAFDFRELKEGTAE